MPHLRFSCMLSPDSTIVYCLVHKITNIFLSAHILNFWANLLNTSKQRVEV